MKTSYLAASIIATAMLASPVAYSASVHGMQVTLFNSYSTIAYGCHEEGSARNCFYAEAYDDFSSGQQLGSVEVSGYDSSTYSYYDIWCTGPAYANVVSVDKNNGDSSIYATLDPSSSDCSNSNYNVSAPVTLDVTGKYWYYQNSNNGIGKETSDGVNYTYNFQNHHFNEAFTGTNGFYTGYFNGYAFTEHRTVRQMVK